MTDKQASNIIMIILLAVLIIICWKGESTEAAVGAYIVGIALLIRVGGAVSDWLERAEQKENSKPL